MGRAPVKAGNERRDKVWFLMLKGNNAQAIAKQLNVPTPTIYQDIRILTNKSKQYVYDMAAGTHVLMFQRAIEGIALTLSEAWDKYNDSKTSEKGKISLLRLTKDCNESILNLAVNGPTVMGIIDLRRRIESFGIDTNKSLQLSEQERVRNYISSRYDKSDFAEGVNAVTSLNEKESKDDTGHPHY